MSQIEINKQLIRPVAITAATLGIIQGVVWMACSILCLCCYFGAITAGTQPEAGDYAFYIYHIFLGDGISSDNGTSSIEDIIVTPVNFSIFMWIYSALSLVWFIESSVVCSVMLHNKWQYSLYSLGIWSTLTLIILCLDLVFVGLIAYDYTIVHDKSAEISGFPLEVLDSYIIVMSVAARGYILWIVDFVLVVILYKFTVNIAQHENSSPDMAIIDAYETETETPPWKLPSDQSPWSVYNNEGYTHTNPGIQRSQSFYQLVTPPQSPQGLPPPTNNNFRNNDPLSNDRAATIDRVRPAQTYLYSVKPPFIPDPDYSPPARLKSVLRSKSNY